MTAEKQHAESHKYIPTQFCVVFQPDGRMSLFYSYGAARTYIGEFSPAELADFLLADYSKQLQANTRRRQMEEIGRREAEERQRSLADLSLELDNALDFSIDGIEIKL